jgi:hypothetical protein
VNPIQNAITHVLNKYFIYILPTRTKYLKSTLSFRQSPSNTLYDLTSLAWELNVHPFLGAFAKLRKATSSFVMSVRLSARPHGTTQAPMEGFPLNSIFQDFSKICGEITILIKVGLHKKTNIQCYS